jgi:hypothetical protein
MTGYYKHQPLNREIKSIGGYYLFTKEILIHLNRRDILYVTGCAAADTSCCGGGGCAFANVPGYILSWKTAKDPDGLYISEVEIITDPKIKNEIRERIRINEGVTQVNFDL